jgi:hypothetical protein
MMGIVRAESGRWNSDGIADGEWFMRVKKVITATIKRAFIDELISVSLPA